ncbi:tRNA methyltransferase complex GCD14 subunit-domain-containing protein [Hyaloraphidium curvatum]|nr:tRNA methyltransferase complex GCD14 subunit-domain-containing protein [Hyaloraphidium curvatum]
MAAAVVSENGHVSNKFGTFQLKDMIGKPWGWQMHSAEGRGFVYLLHPTPELWTLALPHRTQILYMPDISLILTLLEVRPGSVVVESGTGSGSFSHSVARTVGNTGRLFTFEYHEERANLVRHEFAEHGLSETVSVECRDVCRDGFGLQDVADAVFLDLPAPWEAIPHAVGTLKTSGVGRMCCFSPCIEQVQRTCAALHQNGFRELRLFECLLRPHEVRALRMPAPPLMNTPTGVSQPAVHESYVSSRTQQEVRGHTSFLTFALHSPHHSGDEN